MPLASGIPVLQQSIVAAMKSSAAAPNSEAAQQIFAAQLAAAIYTFVLTANPIAVQPAGTATIV
jgi:hypothetical protein